MQPAPEAWAKKEGKADAVVNEDVYGKTEKGKAWAKAGDVVAKAESEPPKKEEKKSFRRPVVRVALRSWHSARAGCSSAVAC